MSSSRFASAVRASIENGFTAQAETHGAALHARAVEMRSRDPQVTFLLDTFDKQVRVYAKRAQDAHTAGNRSAALEMATACQRCQHNAVLIREAIDA